MRRLLVPSGSLLLCAVAAIPFAGGGTKSGHERAPVLQSRVDFDAMAEPGHRAADTLRRLLDRTVERELEKNGTTHGVTINTTPPWPIPPGATGMNVTLSPAESGVTWNHMTFAETFALMLPAGYSPSNPPPIVVAWHGYGTSQNQPCNWGLPAEANARGWILMCPLGVADNTFSWLPGQKGVESSIDWIRTNYPFDEGRVYGVGFSMGATCITNFAARHMSPAWTRFAALATVCGTFDNVESYNFGGAQSIMQTIFFGTPVTKTFEYERTSTIINPFIVNPTMPTEGHTLARALSKVPLYQTWSTDDNVVWYVPQENNSIANYLTSLGNAPTLVPVSGQLAKHSWAVLNVADCFNFFATKTLDPNPPAFTVLADRDAAFHSVTLSAGAIGNFRRFDLAASTGGGTLAITSTASVGVVTIDAAGLGFAGTSDIALTTDTADATSDTIVLKRGASAVPPSKIRRDAVDVYDWTFDAGTGNETLVAPAGTHATDVLRNTFDWNLALTGSTALLSTFTINATGGGAGEAFAILFANGPGALPLSFVGDGDPRFWRLDAGSLQVLGDGFLDGAGESHPSFLVPNNPVIVGLTFPLQAFTATGASAGIPFLVGRISNVLPVTVQ